MVAAEANEDAFFATSMVMGMRWGCVDAEALKGTTQQQHGHWSPLLQLTTLNLTWPDLTWRAHLTGPIQ
jgi:hypothetical protein